MEKKLSQHWQKIQRSLFPQFEAEVGHQTPKHGQIMVVIDYLDFDRFMDEGSGKGRPPRDRCSIARAFVAKAVLNLTSTRALIDRLRSDKVLWRLCGFDPSKRLPSEGTFSNAFAEFAKSGLLDSVHDALIKDQFRGKIVGHISRDSTDIPARGKAPKKAKRSTGKKKKRKKKPTGYGRGRPKKGEVRIPSRRITRQLQESLSKMIEDLPKKFDCGGKRNHRWKGYKLHLDFNDFGVPIGAILTSASVHDSQVAIPLEEICCRRVTSLYSLMDSAYDAKEIRSFIGSKGKVPIIDPHNRQNPSPPLCPAARQRYKIRTTAERGNARLKDDFGARHIRVKGHAKVMAHLMFGVLALTAEQLARHL